MEWISVKDRLPENEVSVLITVKRRHYNDKNKYVRFVSKAIYTDGKHNTEHSFLCWNGDDMDWEYDEKDDADIIPEGWWEVADYLEEFAAVGDFVTHWMPLPKPPTDD